MSPTETAERLGYVPASALNQSITSLNALCERHKIATLTIGKFRFYPKDEVEKRLAEGVADPGMVSATAWCRDHGFNRNKILNAVTCGSYQGRWKRARFGSANKLQVLVYPEEAAAQYLKPAAPASASASAPASASASASAPAPQRLPNKPWLTFAEASAYSRIGKPQLRELLDKGEIESKLVGVGHARETFVETASLDAYLAPVRGAEASPATTPATTPAQDVSPEVLRLIRETSERQREIQAAILQNLTEMQKIEERGVTQRMQFFASLRSRDEELIQGIKDALAETLAEFEQKALEKGGGIAAITRLSSRLVKIEEHFNRRTQQIAADAGVQQQ